MQYEPPGHRIPDAETITQGELNELRRERGEARAESEILRKMVRIGTSLVIGFGDCRSCPLDTGPNWGLWCDGDCYHQDWCRAAIVAWLRYWAECEIEKEKEDEQRDT